MTDVQRLFGEDRLPDEVDVTREGATSPADEGPAAADASAGDEPWTPFDPPAVVVDGDPRDYFSEAPPRVIDLDDGPAPVTMLGFSPLDLEGWFSSLRNPPRPELMGAHAAMLIAAIVGSRSEGGWVRPDDLLAVMPRPTVEEALRRLRYSGHLFCHADGRFRVVSTPLTKAPKENAA